MKDPVPAKVWFPVKRVLHQILSIIFHGMLAILSATYLKVEEFLLSAGIACGHPICPARPLWEGPGNADRQPS